MGTPGVDAAYVGPYDLALSLGLGGRSHRDSAVIEEHIQRVLDAATDAGIIAGMHCDGPETGAYWTQRGARMVTTALDRTAILSVYRSVAEVTREAVSHRLS